MAKTRYCDDEPDPFFFDGIFHRLVHHLAVFNHLDAGIDCATDCLGGVRMRSDIGVPIPQSPAARISSGVICLSRSGPTQTTPPPAIILMKLAPWRRTSRVAAKTSASPSTV